MRTIPIPSRTEVVRAQCKARAVQPVWAGGDRNAPTDRSTPFLGGASEFGRVPSGSLAPVSRRGIALSQQRRELADRVGGRTQRRMAHCRSGLRSVQLRRGPRPSHRHRCRGSAQGVPAGHLGRFGVGRAREVTALSLHPTLTFSRRQYESWIVRQLLVGQRVDPLQSRESGEVVVERDQRCPVGKCKCGKMRVGCQVTGRPGLRQQAPE